MANYKNNPFHFIRCGETNKVLDVEGGKFNAGSKVICYDKKFPSTPNQLWRLEDQGGGRCFIVSAGDHNLVLDVSGGNCYDGAQLIVWNRKNPPCNNQLFCWDNGVIKSCLGNFSVDCANRCNALLWTTHGNGNQRWMIDYI